MADKDESLGTVVERAYRCFAPPKPVDTAACECCWPDATQRDFFAHAQRALPFQHLTEWFNAAVPPEIPQELWAWLLPRILESLAVGEEVSPIGIELTLSRFPTGDARRWSAEEWNVLDSFQRLYLSGVRAESAETLDEILCMFALAAWPADELFAQILAWPTSRLVHQLDFDWAGRAGLKISVTAFWADASVPQRFWSDPALAARFRAFAEDTADDDGLRDSARALAHCIDDAAARS